jgi:ribosome-binding protein aMBF1 (putative translation factor)
MTDRKLTAALERRAAIWDASGGKCHYCGRDLHPFRDFEIEHVVAKCNGGTNAPDNLVASCWNCNRRKRDQVDIPTALARRGEQSVLADGDALRYWRHKRVLSQRELAGLSDVSSNVISSIESGKRQPIRPLTIRKLANALAVDQSALLAALPRNAAGEQ